MMAKDQQRAKPLTPGRVGELAMIAESVTGIKGWVGQYANPGDGPVWSSNRRWLSWRGPRANHMCASYLLGVIGASASGAAMLADPDTLAAQLAALVQVNEVQRGMGRNEGQMSIAAAIGRGGSEERAVREAGAL